MELLARIQLGSELDTLVSELSSGALSMLDKIKKAGRLDEVVSLLTGEAGHAPAATQEAAQEDLYQLLKKHPTLMVRVKKDRKFSVLFRRYHTDLNKSDRAAGQKFEQEMSLDITDDVSGIKTELIRLHKQLDKDLTHGVKLIRQGKYIAIEPYLSPKVRKTPHVLEFLNWLYLNDHLLTGEQAKPDHNGKGEEINDRRHFTVERMVNDRMVYVTFERGEKIKIPQGKGSFKYGVITGISQADKTFKVDNGSYAYEWGYAYKITYDMAKGIREQLERQVKSYEDVNIIMDLDYNRILDNYWQYDKELGYELEDAVERLKAAHILRQEKRKQDDQALADRKAQAEQYAENEKLKEQERRQKLLDEQPEFVEMTMDQWKRTSKDFKHIDNGQRYVLRNTSGRGMVSRPVKIVKAADEPMQDAKEVEDEANAEFEAEAIEQRTGDKPIDEAGVFYQSVIDGAEVDARLIQTALDYAKKDESHYLLPEAAESIKKSVLKMAEVMTD